MKLTKNQHRLINECFELSASEVDEIESLIWSKSKLVKKHHLDDWKCLAAIRGKGTDRQ